MSQQGRRKTKRLLDFQARNQLGNPGGEELSERGTFLTMSNSFKILPRHFSCGGESFSRGGFAPSWLRACGLLYITKKQTLSCVLYAHSQFLCSLSKFDLAIQGLRQPVQPHTFSAQLLVFDETLAQPHFAVLNCSDVGMSVFHSPVLTRSLIFLQLLAAVS